MEIFTYIKPKLKDGTKEKRVIEIEMTPEEYEVQRKLWVELMSGKKKKDDKKVIDNFGPDSVVIEYGL